MKYEYYNDYCVPNLLNNSDKTNCKNRITEF